MKTRGYVRPEIEVKSNKLDTNALLEMIKVLEARVNELELRNFHSDLRYKISNIIKKSKD